jgi:hypothetical protein
LAAALLSIRVVANSASMRVSTLQANYYAVDILIAVISARDTSTFSMYISSFGFAS